MSNYNLSEKKGSLQENYNIFRVINLTTSEERVHSAFIANLLDPKGEHGFKEVFLKLFIEQLGIEGFDLSSATIQAEKDIGVKTETTGGRLDIVVWDKNGCHIIIENKIYAGDQDNQMVRYFSYGQTCPKSHLYYLTLNGETPDDEKSCTNSQTGEVLKVGENYELLSYSSDIKMWLERCREKSATKPLLREGISHYLNLIKYLTNNTMSEALMEETKKVLLKRNNVENLALLKESIRAAEQSLQQQFWDKIRERFINAGYEITLDNVNESIDNYYLSFKRYYGFNVLVEDGDAPVVYCVSIGHYIYGGFSVRVDGVSDKCLLEEYAHYRDYVKQVNNDFKANIYWLGWKRLQPYLNFRAIDEDTCKYLADMDNTVNQMFTLIDEEIKRFKEILNK